MTASLFLPQTVRDGIVAEARAAFPRECCGLIEGTRAGDFARTLETHPVLNLAREPDRFELDPTAHFRLLRELRGTGREIIGCYHSHPNGKPELSARDREHAGEDDFLWLIGASGADGSSLWSCHAARAGIWYKVAIVVSETEFSHEK